MWAQVEKNIMGKRQERVIVDQPGMTSVVTKEYLVVPFTDTLIHKKFFFAWSLFMLLTAPIAAYFFIEWFLLNLWTLIPVAVIITAFLILHNWSSKGVKHKR
jgi:hypothetical protein